MPLNFLTFQLSPLPSLNSWLGSEKNCLCLQLALNKYLSAKLLPETKTDLKSSGALTQAPFCLSLLKKYLHA